MRKNNLVSFPNRRRAREQAGLWLARLDRGLSTAEREGLEQWLAESEAHGEALVELAQRWDELDVLTELAELFPLEGYPGNRQTRPHSWIFAGAGAALVLVAAGWFVATSFVQRAQPVPTTAAVTPSRIYETAIGEQSSVLLSDGSVVTLNTVPLIEVFYSEDQRTVFLRRGEGHFTVASEADRPFNVCAGDRVVQALGTAFNVRLGPSDVVEVAVTEGAVKLGELLESTSATMQARFDGLPTTVAAGEVAIVDQRSSTVERVEPEDMDMRLAWQRGMIVFQGEALEAALAEVSRYTTVRFSMADDQMRNIRVGGYFRAGDVDGLLLALRENFQIESQRIGSDQILLTAQ